MKKIAIIIAVILLPTNMFQIQSSKSKDIEEIIDSINEEILYYHEENLQKFGPHPTGSEACDGVADFIFNEFKKNDLKVEYEYWGKNGLTGKNVIATLEGKTNFIIVISSHYDTVDISPGADDDSSGTSIVLTAAKILSRYNFLHTIKFVTFSGEEQGLLGSEQFVRNSYRRGEKIIADIQLDGVGYAVNEGKKIRISANNASAWLTDIAEEMASKYEDKIDLEISRHGYTGSDHKSFYNYGYEGIFLLEYEFNPNYHSSEDRIEYINLSYMKKICRLTVATAAKIADKEVDVMARITEPEIGGIYIAGRKIIQTNSHYTIVTGKITVIADIITDKEIQKVDFYFDDRFFGTDYEIPYEFTYHVLAFLNHIIRIFAYTEGNKDTNEIDIIII